MHTTKDTSIVATVEFDEISARVIGRAIEVHRVLGPGLLESAYRQCLMHELTLAGLSFQAEKILPVHYKGLDLPAGFRIDLLVEGELVVELKAVEKLHHLHAAQLLTYMRLANCKIGLLLNFNSRVLRDGFRRMVV